MPGDVLVTLHAIVTAHVMDAGANAGPLHPRPEATSEPSAVVSVPE
jgi:hypothetical protein